MAKPIDPEKHIQAINLVKQRTAAQKELNEEMLVSAKIAADALRNLKAQAENATELEERLTKAMAASTATDEQKAWAKKELELLNAKKEAYAGMQGQINAALKSEGAFHKKSQKAYDKYFSSAEKRAIEASKRIQEQNKVNLNDFSGAGATMVRGLGATFSAAGGIFESFAENQKAGIFGIMSMLGIETKATFTALAGAMALMPEQIDSSFRQIVKDTGLFSQEMKDGFIYAMDPLYAMRKEDLFEDALEQPLINVGITAANVGDALGGLVKNVSMFRPAFIAANKETAAYTANLVAGLSKIGISGEDSMSIIEDMTKMLKKSPMEATKQVRRLVKIADTLGVSAAKVSKDFAKALPSLAMFGEEAVDQFANLEAQSTATGLSMDRLIGFAEQMDTFKGAAKAAQGLNAVLGGTFVSVTDLVHAPFDEKLTIIQEAMDRANISFTDAPRRMQQVIAQAAGFKSVGEAMKALGNKDEFEELAEGMETHASSTEEMTEKIKNSMNNAEMLQRSLSSLGGGFSKFVDETRGAAVQGANVMMDGFQGVVDLTKDSQLGVLGILNAVNLLKGATSGDWKSKLAAVVLGAGAAGIDALGGGEAINTGMSGVALPAPPTSQEKIPVSANTTSSQINTLAGVITDHTNTIKAAGKVPIQISVIKTSLAILMCGTENLRPRWAT